MKWLPGENDLVPEQNAVKSRIQSESGNHYVSGFPGSGKSVCLLYSAHAIKAVNPNASILFVEFTHSLIKMIEAALNELHQKYKDLNLNTIKVVTFDDFRWKHRGHYDFIICDEVQDTSATYLNLMKQRADRIIVGGDPNQSIHNQLPNGDIPIDVEGMKSILSPSTSELTIIHRLNKYVINAIRAFMPEMRILAEKSSMLKKHKPVYVWKCKDDTDEVVKIMEDANSSLNMGESVAVLFSNKNNIEKFVNTYLISIGKNPFDFKANKHPRFDRPDYDKLNRYLSSLGIKMQCMTNGYGSLVTDTDKIILCTYHSAKGLDFDKVFLPFCNPGYGNGDDARLFMVAMSRSRKDLILSFTWKPNRFIESFIGNRQACQLIDLTVENSNDSDEDDW